MGKRNIDFAKTEFGQEERDAVNRIMQGYWLASGPENEAFEQEFASYVGTKHAICVNSGSSANLLALQSLDLPKGSKVMTSACGFPATLSPIIHLGLEPVLIDYDISTHNINVSEVIAHLPEVRAIIFAHTLGNPVDVQKIKAMAEMFGVKVIEDCCEAVGTRIGNQLVGSIGDLGTFSFYPAHQITALGGGGMITTNNTELALRIRSMRDWGKMYGWDNYLGDHKTRYSYQVGDIKYFKHYTYETVGYNMKLPEANAAFGREQLKRLDGFTDRRVMNHIFLKQLLQPVKDEFCWIDLIDGAYPSWFGFPLTFKNQDRSRNDFGDHLEERGIRTRPFFAGNITRHKPFLKYNGNFEVADKLMRDSLFIGIWQGLSNEDLEYVADTIVGYLK